MRVLSVCTRRIGRPSRRWFVTTGPLVVMALLLGGMPSDGAAETILKLEPPRFPGRLDLRFQQTDGVSISYLASGTDSVPWVTPQHAMPASRFTYLREGSVVPLTRPGQWVLAGTRVTDEISGGSLAKVDVRNGPFRMTHYFRTSPEAPIIRTWIELRLGGATGADIHTAPSLALRLSTPKDPLRVLRNKSLGFQFEEVQLAAGQRMGLAAGPHSGQRGMDNPWFYVERPDTGEALTGGVEWSGYWRVGLSRDASGITWLDAGIAPGPDSSNTQLIQSLNAGERFETPKVFLAMTNGGLDGAGNMLRPWLSKYVLPPAPDWVREPLYNSWYTFRWDFNEESAKDIIARTADLGVKTFVFDAGWYAGVGDWRSHPDRFPNGVEPLIDDIHQRGMRAGLWVCFQLVAADHPILEQHPDWAVEPRFVVPFMGSAVLLDMGREDVRAWILEGLEKVASTGADWIKYDQDFFPPALDGGHYRLVKGFYAILDEFKRRHPDIMLETCMSGGQISDVAALSRSTSLWMEDGGDFSVEKAESQRQQIRDASIFYPTHYLQRWTCHPDKLPWDEDLIRWVFRCNYGGAWGLCADLRLWTPELTVLAKESVREYSRLNQIKSGAASYRGGLTGEGWEALAFVPPSRERAAVLLYRTTSAEPVVRVRIPGLTPEAWYRVSSLRLGMVIESTGAALSLGLEVPMEGARSEVLWIQPTVAQEK